jgi:hypothetical protein
METQKKTQFFFFRLQPRHFRILTESLFEDMRRERKQYNKRERKSNTESGKATAKTHKQQQQQQPLANAINSQKDLLNTLVINETQIEMKFENELEQMGLGECINNHMLICLLSLY